MMMVDTATPICSNMGGHDLSLENDFKILEINYKCHSGTKKIPIGKLIKKLSLSSNCAFDTELPKEYWKTKKNNFISKVTWSIVGECPHYNLSKRKCYLYLTENLEINSYKGKNLLNKTSTLITTFRHLNKRRLLRYDGKDY